MKTVNCQLKKSLCLFLNMVDYLVRIRWLLIRKGLTLFLRKLTLQNFQHFKTHKKMIKSTVSFLSFVILGHFAMSELQHSLKRTNDKKDDFNFSLDTWSLIHESFNHEPEGVSDWWGISTSKCVLLRRFSSESEHNYNIFVSLHRIFNLIW